MHNPPLPCFSQSATTSITAGTTPNTTSIATPSIARDNTPELFSQSMGFDLCCGHHTGRFGGKSPFASRFDFRKFVQNTPWLMNFGAVFLALLLISISSLMFNDVLVHAFRDQFSAQINTGVGEIKILDLRTSIWSKVEMKAAVETLASPSPTCLAPSADHYLILWKKNLLCVARPTKDSSESVTVLEFDNQTWTRSKLKTNGKIPVSRGGKMVTLVGLNLDMFGGEDAKRSLINDLHILALETMTWDEIDAVGVPPSPMAENVAAVHAERYLLIFGGGSHATCFNDLHALDLKSMECSRPKQQGDVPTAQAGHAGATVVENWSVAGAGDNRSGVSETIVLNMSTLVWSVVTTVKGCVPIASEELQSIHGLLAAQQSQCSDLR